MEYIFLDETPLEYLYRNLTWDIFKYFCNNEKILEIEKYNVVFNEIYNYFIERNKKQFSISHYDGKIIKQEAISRAVLSLDKRIPTKEDVDEYIDNFDKMKHLLVIRPKQKPLD